MKHFTIEFFNPEWNLKTSVKRVRNYAGEEPATIAFVVFAEPIEPNADFIRKSFDFMTLDEAIAKARVIAGF